MYDFINYSSPLGLLTLAGRGDSLAGLWIEGQKYFKDSLKKEPMEQNASPILCTAAKWLDRYFAGEKPSITELSLAPAGSSFRQEVWRILCEIPSGEVTTYGEIAKKKAVRMNRQTMSAQAVGGAVSHNPISIIIPCHRVIGSNGSLTGYAGGIDKKITLLELEGVDTHSFRIPPKNSCSI
ncbi:MAG: methylated-DNA--[protein]-cysteine S-methyltransferase [Eubacteriales bacterium]|nr:methylated-DNA--[protein]-cysteine S-methyltransferase [Eubacteriales bacterium]